MFSLLSVFNNPNVTINLNDWVNKNIRVFWKKTLSLIFVIGIALSTQNSEAKQLELSNSEQRLLNLYIKKCLGEKSETASFPDSYLDVERLAFCEIASYFKPETVNEQLSLLNAAQSFTGATLDNFDYFNQWATRLETANLSQKNEEIINSIVYGETVYNLQNKKVLGAYKELALKGDVPAIYALITFVGADITDNRRFDTDFVASISSHLKQPFADLLLLNINDLREKYSEQLELNWLARNLISKSGEVSNLSLKLAVDAFIQLIPIYSDFWSLKALNLSYELRKSILQLNMLTDSFNDDFIASILILDQSNDEDMKLFIHGSEGLISKATERYEDLEMLSCMQSFEDQIQGDVGLGSPILEIQCIQYFLKMYEDIDQVFSPYFTVIDFNSIREFDLSDYQNWLSLGQKPKNEFYDDILRSEIRFALDWGVDTAFSHSSYVKDLIEADINYAFSFAYSDTIAVQRKYKALKLVSEGLKLSGIDVEIKRKDFSCKTLTQSTCEKIIRSIDVSYLVEGKYKIVQSLSEPFVKCNMDNEALYILREFSKFGIIPDNLQRNCSKDFLIQILAQEGDLTSLAAELLTYPISNDILRNTSLYEHSGFSQFSYHLAFRDKEGKKIALPYEGLGYSSTRFKGLHLIDRAISSINPISKYSDYTFEQLMAPPEVPAGPEHIDTTPYYALAMSYDNVGNSELAFLALHLATKNMLSNNDSPTYLLNFFISETLALGRKAGIPEVFIQEYLLQLREMALENGYTDFSSFIKDLNEDGYHRLDDQNSFSLAEKLMIQYQDGASTEFISAIIAQNDRQKFMENVGYLISATDTQILLACKNPSNSKVLYDLVRDDIVEDYVQKNIHSIQMLKRYQALVSECRNVNPLFSNTKTIESVNEYNKMIDEVSNAISFGTNPISVEYLPIYESLAQYSMRSGGAIGSISSLVFSKYVSRKLMNAFINQDSQMLRTKQNSLEGILVSLEGFGRKRNFFEEYGDQFATRYFTQLNSIAIDAHTPILSDKIRERALFGLNQIPNKDFYYYDDYTRVEEHFNRFEKALAEVTGPVEFAFIKSQKALHPYSLPLRNNSNSLDIEQFIINWPNNEESKHAIILNINYRNGGMFLQAMGPGKFIHDFFELDDEIISQTKQFILGSSELHEENIKKLCMEFQQVHNTLNQFKNELGQINNVIVVPSVNLFPIPLEIILGTYCNTNNKIPILHAADIGAAMEVLSKDYVELPSAFVGMGNPTSKNRGIQIPLNIVLRNSAAFNEDGIFDVEDLPPLPDASQEVKNVSKLFDRSEVLLNVEASVSKALSESQNNIENIILLATHGIKPSYESGIVIPSLLSSEDGELELFESVKVERYDLDGDIVLLSACDTASGFVDRPDLFFTGFVTSFANAGGDLMLASLWPVYSKASQEVTETFVSKWKDSSIYEAIDSSKKAPQISRQSLPFVYIYP